jgi:Family of unknown function (DUF5715)
MMRLNAPIPALLALAGLSFLPACGLAKSMRHPDHKAHVAAISSTKHPAHPKSAAKPVHQASASAPHSAGRAKTAPIATRVADKQPSRHHHRRQSISAPAPKEILPALTVAATTPEKATSEDFLKAASSPAEIPPPVAIHGTSRPDEPTVATTTPTTAQRHASVAKPVPVVSVIRPTAEKPQLASVEEAASTPVILPELYNKRGRLIVPPPLKGSHEILVHQNEVADRDGLHRIQDDDDLLDMRSKHLLVALPDNSSLQVDDRLPTNRRFCRPWTADFLATMARAHYAHFHTPLQVNSAVRTVEFQQHLMHINGNAAPAEGDTASPHLTGQAIDIAKHGLSLTEIAWLRGYLLPLVQEGKVDVEEEFQQSCFHISVYKSYLPSSPERELAISHHGGTSALATALR